MSAAETERRATHEAAQAAQATAIEQEKAELAELR